MVTSHAYLFIWFYRIRFYVVYLFFRHLFYHADFRMSILGFTVIYFIADLKMYNRFYCNKLRCMCACVCVCLSLYVSRL